ncbi:hypothetical protein LEMLEM_LOCUS7019 [Lemmus lemmus]
MVQKHSSWVHSMSGCRQGHRHPYVGTAAGDRSGHGPAAEQAPGVSVTVYKVSGTDYILAYLFQAEGNTHQGSCCQLLGPRTLQSLHLNSESPASAWSGGGGFGMPALKVL